MSHKIFKVPGILKVFAVFLLIIFFSLNIVRHRRTATMSSKYVPGETKITVEGGYKFFYRDNPKGGTHQEEKKTRAEGYLVAWLKTESPAYPKKDCLVIILKLPIPNSVTEPAIIASTNPETRIMSSIALNFEFSLVHGYSIKNIVFRVAVQPETRFQWLVSGDSIVKLVPVSFLLRSNDPAMGLPAKEKNEPGDNPPQREIDILFFCTFYQALDHLVRFLLSLIKNHKERAGIINPMEIIFFLLFMVIRFLS